MSDVEITLRLPESLYRTADALGLLSSEQLAQLLRAEVDARLQAMAADAEVQRELRAINADFQHTEWDGLDEDVDQTW